MLPLFWKIVELTAYFLLVLLFLSIMLASIFASEKSNFEDFGFSAWCFGDIFGFGISLWYVKEWIYFYLSGLMLIVFSESEYYVCSELWEVVGLYVFKYCLCLYSLLLEIQLDVKLVCKGSQPALILLPQGTFGSV